MVSNVNLAQAGRVAGLDALVIGNPSQLGMVSDKTVATTVEALLGAVYLDSGKDIVAVKSAMRALGLGPV